MILMNTLLKRHWPLLGLGVLVLVVVFYLARSGKGLLPTSAILTEMAPTEGLNLKDIHYRQDDPEGKVKWVLDAEEVRFTDDKQTIDFRKFRLKVDPEEGPGVELRGDGGRYSRESDSIELWGDLKGSYGGNYRLYTDSLMISDHLRTVGTERWVEIVGPFFTVRGRGLSADVTLQRIKIWADVTTTLKGDVNPRE